MPTNFLSTRQQNAVRDWVEAILPSSGIVYRNQGTVTAAGNKQYTYTAVGTANCRIDIMSRQESTLAGELANREASKSWYTLTMAWDTDLQLGDRVEIASVKYELIQLHDQQTYHSAVKATVTDIQGDQ